MENRNVTEIYESYKNGGMDKRSFENHVFKHLFSERQSCGHYLNGEDYADFIAGSYQRISGAIDRYVPREGVSFGAFLGTTVKFMFRQYVRQKKICETRERIYWRSAAVVNACCNGYDSGENSLPELFNETCVLPAENKVKLKPQQILVLLLKSYNFADMELLEKLAPRLNYSAAELFGMIEKIRSERREKDAKLQALNLRCQRTYFRYAACETQLYATEKSDPEYSRLREKLKQRRLRLFRLRNVIKSRRVPATNKQVAGLLKIPKGTVDSILFSLKRRYAVKQKNKDLCPATTSISRQVPRPKAP
jgi:hypothetical protein